MSKNERTIIKRPARSKAMPYLLPAAVIMAVMLGFPIVYNLVLSFMKWAIKDPTHPYIGLENYLNVLTDSNFLKVLLTTVLWTVAGVVLQMVIGIGLALFTENLTRGKKLMRIMILIPWIIPGVVTALMWKWLLQSDVGLINYILMASGIAEKNTLFLSSPDLAIVTLILVNTWKATPFWFLMITAGLQSKPLDQIEAARLDGANAFQVLKNVTLPHLSPVIASTGVLTTIWTLNYFDLIWVVTKGGPVNATTTLPIFIYREAFEFNDFGASAACAMISFVIVTLISVPYIKKMFNNLKYEGVL